MNWQPIETAPKDGAQIILWCEDGQCTVAEYFQRYDGFCGWEIAHNCDGARQILAVAATHWMPIPEPPKAPGS